MLYRGDPKSRIIVRMQIQKRNTKPFVVSIFMFTVGDKMLSGKRVGPAQSPKRSASTVPLVTNRQTCTVRCCPKRRTRPIAYARWSREEGRSPAAGPAARRPRPRRASLRPWGAARRRGSLPSGSCRWRCSPARAAAPPERRLGHNFSNACQSGSHRRYYRHQSWSRQPKVRTGLRCLTFRGARALRCLTFRGARALRCLTFRG